MTGDKRDKQSSRFRRLIRSIVALLKKPARSTLEQLAVGFVGAGLFASVSAGIGWLLGAFDVINLTGNVPAFLVALAGGLGLLVGLIVGTFIVESAEKQIKETELEEARQETAQVKQERDELAKELTQALLEAAQLSQQEEAMLRPEAYAKHLHLLLAQLRRDGLVNVPRDLLEAPAIVIAETTGIKPRLSIWVERNPVLRRAKWELELAPEHSDAQIRDFEVPVVNSWIYLLEHQNRDSDEFAFGLSNIERSARQGRDLEAFLKHGFRSLCATSVTRFDNGSTAEDDDESELRCLVALAEESKAFSPAEQWYFTFLARILSLHTHMGDLSDGLGDTVSP